MKKIVTIGGGTGQYTFLKGLKNYDVDLTAIVNIVDNGGSSGGLRTEFGILPPGDIRNCLIALADDANVKELADLFAYRFKSEGLNHNLGNLILTALSQKYGNMAEATKVASRILGTKGKVLPVSINSTNLFAETELGTKLDGESEISEYPGREKITKLWLEPKAFIYREAADAIKNADLVVISSGELYSSILPNFLVEGFKEAITESNAKIVYVCNLVTKQGSYGFKASDFVAEIKKYLGKAPDCVICNTKKPTQKVVDKYVAKESFFVECDLEGEHILKEELLVEFEVGDLVTARHDPAKIAKILLEL